MSILRGLGFGNYSNTILIVTVVYTHDSLHNPCSWWYRYEFSVLAAVPRLIACLRQSAMPKCVVMDR